MKDVFLEYLNCSDGSVVAINPEHIVCVVKMSGGFYSVQMSNGKGFMLNASFGEQFCKVHGISAAFLK